MNTPIYLALLLAAGPLVKGRVDAYVARCAPDEAPPRPRLDAALRQET